MVKVSPIATVLDEDNAPFAYGFPPVEASHREICEYVSAAGTLVHVAADVDVLVPVVAVSIVTDALVVFEAALPVASSPGSPVCSFTYRVLGILLSSAFSA